MNMLCGITNKWRRLGTQFGFSNNELQTIKMNASEPMDCLQEVIATKKARSTYFGWTDVVKALNAMEEYKLANRICQEYKIAPSQTQSGKFP